VTGASLHVPLLGTIAGVLTVGSFVPQVVRAWRT
jgi:uncharacterized protein with PQ loop repeat